MLQDHGRIEKFGEPELRLSWPNLHTTSLSLDQVPPAKKGPLRRRILGKRVALVERTAHLGGASINTGTVPSKTLRETALYFSGLRQRGLYGIDYSLKDGLSIGDFMYRERTVVNSEHGIVRQNLNHHKAEILWGTAVLEDPHTVRITKHDGSIARITTDIILVA
jgi:NAD(P) transhydrogenase